MLKLLAEYMGYVWYMGIPPLPPTTTGPPAAACRKYFLKWNARNPKTYAGRTTVPAKSLLFRTWQRTIRIYLSTAVSYVM